MLGLRQDYAMDALSKNCTNIFRHSHLRKTFKGVAELVIRDQKEEEEEKMQI